MKAPTSFALFLLFDFSDRVFLRWPLTSHPPALAFQMLELKACLSHFRIVLKLHFQISPPGGTHQSADAYGSAR